MGHATPAKRRIESHELPFGCYGDYDHFGGVPEEGQLDEDYLAAPIASELLDLKRELEVGAFTPLEEWERLPGDDGVAGCSGGSASKRPRLIRGSGIYF